MEEKINKFEQQKYFLDRTSKHPQFFIQSSVLQVHIQVPLQLNAAMSVQYSNKTYLIVVFFTDTLDQTTSLVLILREDLSVHPYFRSSLKKNKYLSKQVHFLMGVHPWSQVVLRHKTCILFYLSPRL